MTANTLKGLAKADDIYRNRSKRARELKAEGKKVFGYFCCYPPVEFFTALDVVPFRLLGDMDEPITVGDGYLPPVMCIFYRSVFDISKKDRYDFLDGFVGCHACDGCERTTHIWKDYMITPYSFYLDVPHTAHKASIDFFKGQMEYLKKTLEEHTGKQITPEALNNAIAVHNKQRALVRDLYDLRKSDPPLITGSEVLKVIIATMCMPVEEGNKLLEDVIEEIKTRTDVPEKKVGRILVWGSLIDNTALTELVENSGMNIVMDDTAIGYRPFMHDVEISSDPVFSLAEHYLVHILCPRTFRETGASYMDDLEDRFSYLKEFAKEWNVNGAYLNIVRNCDPHGYEVPGMKDYLESLGLPVLVLEEDYSTASLEPLRTRLQALKETIAG